MIKISEPELWYVFLTILFAVFVAGLALGLFIGYCLWYIPTLVSAW